MIAFDTNLLVRVAVADEPAQVAIVRDLILSDMIFLSRTVLLEAEWVLRSVYGKPRGDVLMFFRGLLEVEDTEIENRAQVKLALDWYELGADFADAMHLAVCRDAVMHTFDGGFCKAARAAGVAPDVKALRAGPTGP